MVVELGVKKVVVSCDDVNGRGNCQAKDDNW